MRNFEVVCADVLAGLAGLPTESVQCCVTSPPYRGLRDYGMPGQIGLESTPDAYVARVVEVFREVRRVLAKDGVLWLNLGDSYAGGGRGDGAQAAKQGTNVGSLGFPPQKAPPGLRAKDLVGIPWMVAFALRADGWYLRQDIIWHKPNPMPESVLDRCTKAHEYLFLLSKSARYYFDAKAISEAATGGTPGNKNHRGAAEYAGGDEHHRTKTGLSSYAERQRAARDSFKREGSKRAEVHPGQSVGTHRHDRAESEYDTATRNKRSVWTINTKPFSGAHFAVMPEALVEPCIKAGSREGDTVLDPFAGSGTVGVVALRLNRRFVGIELNPEYAAMARNRIASDAPLLNLVAAQ